MDAWAIVFDSEIGFADKAPHLENAAQLESTVAAYAETGAQFGGVSLEPTAVSIDGDVATITYNVLFGGSAAYSDLSGEMELTDGVLGGQPGHLLRLHVLGPHSLPGRVTQLTGARNVGLSSDRPCPQPTPCGVDWLPRMVLVTRHQTPQDVKSPRIRHGG